MLKKVVGVDAAPVLAVSVTDSDAAPTGVPFGSVVKLEVVASNAVGDGAASEVLLLQAASWNFGGSGNLLFNQELHPLSMRKS